MYKGEKSDSKTEQFSNLEKRNLALKWWDIGEYSKPSSLFYPII